MDGEPGVHAIIVGVDAKDQDILPAVAARSTSEPSGEEGNEEETGIVETGQRCPPDCPPPSPLNP